jgi:hypothetical protein
MQSNVKSTERLFKVRTVSVKENLKILILKFTSTVTKIKKINPKAISLIIGGELYLSS